MNFREDKTIVALSSAPGISGIAVLRMSGAQAGPIAASVFREPRAKCPFYTGPSHTIHYGWIVDPAGERVDEVLLMWMKGPGTYTGEDTVEINCHGGPYVSRRVMETLVQAGAELAEPGEYSRRAYLNGKMDLTKAEAVMDLISSETELSRRASVSQLRGSLFEKTEKLRARLLDLLTETEVNIDYPEYDVPEVSSERLLRVCGEVADEARQLYHTAEAGRVLRSGIRTAIVGAPNVGKSSLLNLLSGTDRAIVTDIPGTTRDTLEETVDLDGVPLRITDTAGIRETSDTVERLGVERACRVLGESDLVLLVVDASRPVTEEDDELLRAVAGTGELLRTVAGTGELLWTVAGPGEQFRTVMGAGKISADGGKPAPAASCGKTFLVLLNKSDAATFGPDELAARWEKIVPGIRGENRSSDGAVAGDSRPGRGSRIIRFSAKTGEGRDELSARIKELFLGGIVLNDHTPLITNLRQKQALAKAIEALERVAEGGRAGFELDLLAIDLHEAYDALGEISGHSVDTDLTDAVFSRFCLGK